MGKLLDAAQAELQRLDDMERLQVRMEAQREGALVIAAIVRALGGELRLSRQAIVEAGDLLVGEDPNTGMMVLRVRP